MSMPKPIRDLVMVLLVPIAEEIKTPSGIIVPGAANETENFDKPRMGVVAGVGPLVKTVKEMDQVLIDVGAAIEAKWQDDPGGSPEVIDCFFVHERDVMCVLEGEGDIALGHIKRPPRSL